MKRLGVVRPLVWGVALLGVGLGAATLGCTRSKNPWEGLGEPPRIVASFPPLYCFARNVAGDDAAILSVLAAHGPHDYPFDLRDLLPLQEADVFFANGLGLDEFAAKLKNNSGNGKLTFVEVAAAIPTDRLRYGEIHHGDHVHRGADPHVWLGVAEAKIMVEKIRDTLKQKSPEKAAEYDRRTEAYLKRLDALRQYGADLLKDKKNRNLITTHDSLFYFARSFGLNVVGSIEPRPGLDPDPKQIAKLADLCKEQDVHVIAVEPQYPTRDADVLNETLAHKGLPKATVVTVDPLETGPPAPAADWYEQMMRTNLQNLAKGLP